MIPYRIFDNITNITTLLSGGLHGLLLYPLVQYLPLFY
jgi:hypothetical protein